MLRLCGLSRFLCEKAVNGMTHTIPEQIRIEVCNILSEHLHKDGMLTIDSAPTHEEIAQRVGTNREQVTRVMAEFKKGGFITQSGKSWHVADVNAVLEALLEGI
jgi:CRP/FNR family cyclic AMP-dependent transcriptional regulator